MKYAKTNQQQATFHLLKHISLFVYLRFHRPTDWKCRSFGKCWHYSFPRLQALCRKDLFPWGTVSLQSHSLKYKLLLNKVLCLYQREALMKSCVKDIGQVRLLVWIIDHLKVFHNFQSICSLCFFSGRGEGRTWRVLSELVRTDSRSALPHIHDPCFRGAEKFLYQRQVKKIYLYHGSTIIHRRVFANLWF